MAARIDPAPQPYEPDMEETLAKLMPEGVEPLLLFRMLARSPRLSGVSWLAACSTGARFRSAIAR